MQADFAEHLYQLPKHTEGHGDMLQPSCSSCQRLSHRHPTHDCHTFLRHSFIHLLSKLQSPSCLICLFGTSLSPIEVRASPPQTYPYLSSLKSPSFLCWLHSPVRTDRLFLKFQTCPGLSFLSLCYCPFFCLKCPPPHSTTLACVPSSKLSPSPGRQTPK